MYGLNENTDEELGLGTGLARSSTGGSTGFLNETIQGIGYGGQEFLESVGVRWLWNKTAARIDDSFKWEEGPIDRPDTMYGKILGGVAQFAIPYGALSAGLKAASGASWLVKAGKTGRFVKWLGGNPADTTVKALRTARAAGDSGGMISTLSVHLAGNLGRSTVKGGLVDFLAFGGTEERLSNIIQENPTLANPFTEWLAHDDEENEFAGRFKNALEGALIGAPLELIFDGFKAARIKYKVLQNGGTTEEAQAAAVKAFDDAIEGHKADFKAEEDEYLGSTLDREHTYIDFDGEERVMTDAEIEGDMRILATDLQKAEYEMHLDRESDEYLDHGMDGMGDVSDEYAMDAKLPDDADWTPEELEELRKMELEEDQADRLGKALDNDADLPETLKADAAEEGGTNLRKASKEYKKANRVPNSIRNLAKEIGMEDSMRRLLRAIDELDLIERKVTESEEQFMVRTLKWARDNGEIATGDFEQMALNLAGDVRSINIASQRVRMYRMIQTASAPEVVKKLEMLSRPDVTYRQMREAVNSMNNFLVLQRGIDNTGSSLGRALQTLKARINSDEITKDILNC